MRLAFVMLDMPGWEEDRDRGRCFEHLYAWLEMYSLTCDPFLLARLDALPALVGVQEYQAAAASFDLLVAAGRQVCEELAPATLTPGLWFDPPEALLADFPHAGPCAGLRERVDLGAGDYFLPSGLDYWAFAGNEGFGRIGDWPLVMTLGAVAVSAVDLGRLLYGLQYRRPEQTRADLAGLLTRVYVSLLGEDPSDLPACDGSPASLRRDFHAFGVSWALFTTLLQVSGDTSPALTEAPALVLAAARAYASGDESAACQGLAAAFGLLAHERARLFPTRVHLIDAPHCGILFPQGGFFEAEWPQYCVEFLDQFLPFLEDTPYHLSLETNLGTLAELCRRYPAYHARLRALTASGKLELLNGTYAAPLSQFTGLEAAAREFEVGQRAVADLGLTIDTYACQEFSFTPALPGLLRDLGYRRALHATQNRGACPEADRLFFAWQGCDGRSLPALGQHHLNLIRRGNNTYLELPFAYLRAREEGVPELVVACFQDQGYLPLRFEVLRAHRYAPVWGEHTTFARVIAPHEQEDLPSRAFPADEYHWETPYWGPTSQHLLSSPETQFAYAHRLLALESLASAAGMAGPLPLDTAWETCLMMEAHDHLLCPAGAPGSFYGRSMFDYAGPRSPVTLGDALTARREAEAPLLDALQASALASGGLSPASSDAPPVVLNPSPHDRAYGAFVPGLGEDLALSAGNLLGWSAGGTGYLAGTLPAGSWEPLTAAAPGDSAACGDFAWTLRPGEDAVTCSAGEVTLHVSPRLASGSDFRLCQCTSHASGPASLGFACWEDAASGVTVQLRLTGLAGSPLLFLDAEIGGYDPGVVDKLSNALYLRLVTPAPFARVRSFLSHLLQETAKEVITSPYLLVGDLPEASLSLINFGALWHRREDQALEVALMVPLEGLPRRRFALGLNLADPIAAAYDLNEPLLLASGDGPGRLPAALRCLTPGVRVTSCRPVPGSAVLRLAETSGQAQDVVLTCARDLASAAFLYERGRSDSPAVSASEIRFRLRPHEFTTLQVSFA